MSRDLRHSWPAHDVPTPLLHPEMAALYPYRRYLLKWARVRSHASFAAAAS